MLGSLTNFDDLLEGHPAYISDYIQNNMMGATIDPEIKLNVLPFLKQNFGKMSEREMARRLNLGKTTVNRWCRELELFVKKDTVNEDYFKKWSPEMAYILGFIFADGNLNWKPEKSYRALTITASEKDVSHLEKIRLKMKSSKELTYSKKTKSYRLIVNSRIMCIDLMNLGLIPRKSLKIKFPKLPKEHIRHFIRGIIDGDGNVRYVKRKISPYFEITIASGSKHFLESLSKEISSIGIGAKIRKVQKNTHILQYSCQRGLKLANWIYNDSHICLERKFQQYKEALSAKGGGMPWREFS